MRRLLFLLILPLIIPAAEAEWLWPPDDATVALVEKNLSRHYQSEHLRAWLDAANPAERAAMEFLLAWMPASDLGSWPADMLIENVELALAERRPGSDDFTFHAFVLPHRVSQEPPGPWRPRLRGMLAERVAGLGDGEAALEVNRFCREWATFRPSSRRDQPPLTTLERGIGRCEEETILLVCALRSVGLPARQCYTPFWATGDNNHAWVEVMCEDGWHYLGACEPEACLDRAWFTAAARRAGLVLSVGYGEAPVPRELEGFLYRQEDGATILNSSDVYTEPGWLTVPGPIDETLAEASWIWVHVFNFGAPMALGRTRMNEPLALGPGDFLLTSEIGGHPFSALAHVAPGESTELRLEKGLRFLDGPVWLRYPEPGDAAGGDCKREKEGPLWDGHKGRLEKNDEDRTRRASVSREWKALVAEHPESAELIARLEEAGPAQERWAEAVLATYGETRSLALELTLQMDGKDFYEIDSSRLEETLARIEPFVGAGTAPDSLFGEFVLSPRILFQAGTLDWWTELPRFEESHPDSLLARFREQVSRAGRTRGGHVATPAQSWSSGLADEVSARVCLAGLLRRHGLPARVLRGLDTVDVWRENSWRSLAPFPVEADDAEVTGEPEAALIAEYFAAGEPFENVETWRQTQLTRFADGHFEPWFAGQLSEGEGRVEWRLPSGRWWLFAGQRNGRGEPRFVSREIVLAPGDSARVSMDFAIPIEEMAWHDLVRREWDASTRLILKRRGESRALRRFGRGEAKLLVLGLAKHEPSIRHGEALGLPEGLRLVPIQVRGVAGHRPDKRAWTIRASEAERIFGLGNLEESLPLSVLIDENGATLLWLPGMRQDLAGHIDNLMSGR